MHWFGDRGSCFWFAEVEEESGKVLKIDEFGVGKWDNKVGKIERGFWLVLQSSTSGSSVTD